MLGLLLLHANSWMPDAYRHAHVHAGFVLDFAWLMCSISLLYCLFANCDLATCTAARAHLLWGAAARHYRRIISMCRLSDFILVDTGCMHARLMSISSSPTCFLMLIRVNSEELVGKMPLPITPSHEVPLQAICRKLLKGTVV